MAPSTKDRNVQDEAIEEALDRPDPVAWRPIDLGPGATIMGTLMRVEDRTTQYGPTAAMILANDEGEHAVYLFFESLRTQLGRLRPAAGERVAVRYLGHKDVKNPTQGRATKYHDFKVAVDRPADMTTVDWAATLASTAPANPDEGDGEDIPFD